MKRLPPNTIDTDKTTLNKKIINAFIIISPPNTIDIDKTILIKKIIISVFIILFFTYIFFIN